MRARYLDLLQGLHEFKANTFSEKTFADIKQCPGGSSQFYCGLDPTFCDDTSKTFLLQLGLLADFRNTSTTTITASATGTASTREASTVTSLITITATPTAQPKKDTSAVAVGVGIGVPLGLALTGALIFIYGMRKGLERATRAEKAAVLELHQSGFPSVDSGYVNAYRKDHNYGIQEAPDGYNDHIHEVAGN